MQLIDLAKQYSALKPDLHQAIDAVLAHGQFILGPEVQQLEEELAAFVGVQHCITCANGTDALQLVFMAYGIGAGDAVFCPDITFVASVEPAQMLGATPVFCDIEMASYNLCPHSLEQQILAVQAQGQLRPRAVVAVDFLGVPANYTALQMLCKKHKLLLIEDAAQSMGAVYKQQRCGSFGDIATTSFFPAKPLGCYGDGGAIFTNSNKTAALLRSLRVHGKAQEDKYHNVHIGINSRLDTIQAAVLRVKLKAFPQEILARQQVASQYNRLLKSDFTVPTVPPDSLSVYAQYALLATSATRRDQLRAALTQNGIPSTIYYPRPMHQQPVFGHSPHYGQDFKNATQYCARTFSIPMHPYLTTQQAQQIGQVLLHCAPTSAVLK